MCSNSTIDKNSCFKIDDIVFATKRNSKAFSDKTSQDLQNTLNADAPLMFYAIFDSECQPNRLLVSEPKIDEFTSASQVNFFRGILNQFKVRKTASFISHHS